MGRVPRRIPAVIASLLLVAGLAAAPQAAARPSGPFTAHQRAVLQGIARDTWRFFESDVDPRTHLPLDNVGPGATRGTYTSAANVGVYLWAVVAAADLHLIPRRAARTRIRATLHTVARLRRSHGFLYQWYDTTTGAVIRNPGDIDCAAETTPTQDNCFFLSAVDNGWYASGLVVVRQAFPALRRTASALIRPMDFSIFYDGSAETRCTANTGGQQFGGFYVDQGPAGYHNSAIYSDPRIAMYLGMGLGQMPGDVWWRSWRTLPPPQCPGDPAESGQGQPAQGHWASVRDPRSGKTFRVWEGHYTYPGTTVRFLPTFAGGMFEALMANEVVPETTWGPRSFGLADRRTVDVQIRYARQQLNYPVWGLSPSSTADDTGGYNAFGAAGAALLAGRQLAQCPTCATETTVTPHASFLALPVAPQRAYANIVRLRTEYPDSYRTDGGFFDAVNPTTGAVGHRRLVLDQSMVLAGLDDALNDRALQRYFTADPVARAAKQYLAAERMSLR
jgi:Putative glucoamylase/Protein of unknown function (DUF3131)